jgi:hypothetical protein
MIRLYATPVLTVITILASLGLGVATSAWAAPITLVPNTLNMFRDTRGLNDVGLGQGDVFQYGANIQGGSLGSTLGAVYPTSGFTDPQSPCAPLTVSLHRCVGRSSHTNHPTPNRSNERRTAHG